MKLKQFLPALAAGSALLSGGVMAASDGTLGVDTGAGATSTGSSVITLTVPDLIKISNLDNIGMSFDGTDYVGSDDVCVYRNVTGEYSVTATSANGGAGTFLLDDGGTSTVEYSVDWAGTALTESSASGVLADADQTSVSCGGTPNIAVTVTATETDVAAATATGAHTDTLSLMVTAE